MHTFYGSFQRGSTNARPAIHHFGAIKNDQHIALVIFAGGGYQWRSDHEAFDYARFFQQHGIHGFVVDYRLGTQGHHHPAMLEDALGAIESIRANAQNFGIDQNKVGVIGSSAGGHVAALAATHYRFYDHSEQLRPDFAVLCYPVISITDSFAYPQAQEYIIAPSATPQQIQSLNVQTQITPDTPPCYLWHAIDDDIVPYKNSMVFADALQKQNVLHELHIYSKGGHGMGLDTPVEWATPCVEWIHDRCS